MPWLRSPRSPIATAPSARRRWMPSMPNGSTSRWWWTSGWGGRGGPPLPGTLAEVRKLLAHPAFDIRNPNKVYALIRSFCGNHVRFHAADGGGYAFLAAQGIAIDAF